MKLAVLRVCSWDFQYVLGLVAQGHGQLIIDSFLVEVYLFSRRENLVISRTDRVEGTKDLSNNQSCNARRHVWLVARS